MEAVKQIVRVPKNHEIKIKVPQEFPENEIVEVILLIKKKHDKFKQKMMKLKATAKDDKFIKDIKEISEDFRAVDLEGLDDTI